MPIAISQPSIKEGYEPEFLLLLRAALFKLTIWDHNATYGAALQNLVYTDARRSGPIDYPPTLLQKSTYGLLTVGGRYLFTRLNLYLLSRSNPEDVSPPPCHHHRPILTHFFTVNPLHRASLPPRRLRLHRALHPLLHLFHCLPPHRALSHPPRPRPTHASRLPLPHRLPRSLIRIPQPPTRLARLHRIPPLHPPSDPGLALAALVGARATQDSRL